MLHDITDLRRADQIRRDFVANVSHELRTPLTAIRGYVEALLDGDADAGDARRFLEIIARHTLRMERLVRDLLRLARLDAGQETLERVPCSIEQPVRRASRPTSARMLDDARQQVVDARSIADAADGAGRSRRSCTTRCATCSRTRPTTRPRTAPSSMRAAAASADASSITVADEGPGIPEADLPRVFERFYRVDKSRARRDPGGTGLGLAIVKHLVELHGGSGHRARTGPAAGARFTIELPADATAAPAGSRDYGATVACSDPVRRPRRCAAAAGNRQHPRPDDPAGDAPAHGRQPAGRADADDRAGDRVRRADRHAEMRRGEERDRAAPVSAAKPPTGCSLVIFDPIVWMIRQPPASVPSRSRRAPAASTQNGM